MLFLAPWTLDMRRCCQTALDAADDIFEASPLAVPDFRLVNVVNISDLTGSTEIALIPADLTGVQNRLKHLITDCA